MYQAAIDKIAARGLIRDRYDNFIGGKWVAPVEGRYFDNPSPVTGKRLCSVPRSSSADVELALDAAHKAKDAWGKTSAAERALILNRIADKMESNLDPARHRRDARQRQADPRDDLRRPSALHRPLALLRRGNPRAGRRHFRDRP
jgi:Aldehyde dehydrogenase family